MQVDVVNRSASVDLDNYVFNGEWELLTIGVRRNEIVYACCVEPYPDVTFTIVIRRRTLYYLFNVIFPCLWLTVLSLVGFWLPPDSGEKITLGITVLLAFSVFMLMIAENMPATSEFVPLMGMADQSSGRNLEINPLMPNHCCHMDTAIKHLVPDRVKLSFVIFFTSGHSAQS